MGVSYAAILRANSLSRAKCRKLMRLRERAAIMHPQGAAHYDVIRPLLENALPKPPNYKQDKKRREEMQKRKNQEEQERKAARKSKTPDAPG
jgi:hypothetical protein